MPLWFHLLWSLLLLFFSQRMLLSHVLSVSMLMGLLLRRMLLSQVSSVGQALSNSVFMRSTL